MLRRLLDALARLLYGPPAPGREWPLHEEYPPLKTPPTRGHE